MSIEYKKNITKYPPERLSVKTPFNIETLQDLIETNFDISLLDDYGLNFDFQASTNRIKILAVSPDNISDLQEALSFYSETGGLFFEIDSTGIEKYSSSQNSISFLYERNERKQGQVEYKKAMIYHKVDGYYSWQCGILDVLRKILPSHLYIQDLTKKQEQKTMTDKKENTTTQAYDDIERELLIRLNRATKYEDLTIDSKMVRDKYLHALKIKFSKLDIKNPLIMVSIEFRVDVAGQLLGRLKKAIPELQSNGFLVSDQSFKDVNDKHVTTSKLALKNSLDTDLIYFKYDENKSEADDIFRVTRAGDLEKFCGNQHRHLNFHHHFAELAYLLSESKRLNNYFSYLELLAILDNTIKADELMGLITPLTSIADLEKAIIIQKDNTSMTTNLSGLENKTAEELSKLTQVIEQIKTSLVDSVGLEQRFAKLDKKLTDEIRKKNPKKLEINLITDQGTTTIQEHQHYKFPLVMSVLSVGLNLALYGQAGTGKSYMAKKASEALKRDFYTVSFNALSSKADILGFIDANGIYHASAFRQAYEHGGIFLADELDACNSGVATIMNSAIANNICTFADNNTIQAHKDFLFIAAMNTTGSGGNHKYTSRSRLDAATLDRFCFIELDHDAELEKAMIGLPATSNPVKLTKGGQVTTEDWLGIVCKFRNYIETKKIDVVVSARASLYGAKLASIGVGKDHLLDMLLFKGMNKVDTEPFGKSV